MDPDRVIKTQRHQTRGPLQFRLQFFGVTSDRRPTIVGEVNIQATDASAAIRAATVVVWPPKAIGFRILDREGREVFERLKADRR
jgi:hypothetical protein